MRPLVRLWFRALSALRPRAAEWQAADLFMTPRRRPRRDPELPGVTRREHRLDAGAVTLQGWSWGEGPVVLLVHGWSGRSADLSTIAASLVARGFQALAYDMPAHGATDGKRTSLADWMRVLPAIAGRHGAVHAVVAHSLGAAGVTLALEDGMQASRVVLLAPPRGPRYFVAQLQQFIGLPGSRLGGMIARLEYLTGHEIAFFDAARAASSLAMPVLIIHDPADDEVPFEHGEAVARAWRGSELVAVEAVGHYRILRAPHVVERVVAFVAGVEVQESGARAKQLQGENGSYGS